ncbi:EbsA family protein [Levilactobacillus bambusae]|uniref:Pore-forming protein n=1 Tax=Levilactobacillus bambusae TaxID=2024736 RepID=A0A2V1N4L1_9LACO|nr:EbsA family protein [Levilactobacillus bambusae]PWG00865.1 pore-forming protein [Levilactobacillus bambusae]
MLNQERRFLYQPGPLSTIINWSWTFSVAWLGIIIWLEATKFQWATFSIFLVFAVLCWAEVHYRNVTLKDNRLQVSRILNHHWLTIPLDDIESVTASRYRLAIIVHGRIYQFLLPHNSVLELKEIIDQTAHR